LHLRFTLPGINSKPIEATAELVWTNSTGKGGGLQFVEIAEEARVRLQQWISMGGLNVTDTVRRPASVIPGPAGTVAAAADADTIRKDDRKTDADEVAAANLAVAVDKESATAAGEKAAAPAAKSPLAAALASRAALLPPAKPPAKPVDPLSPAVAEFLSRAATPPAESIPEYELEEPPLESEGDVPALAYEGISEHSGFGERRSLLASGAIILASASLGLLLAMLGMHVFGSPGAGGANVAERVRAAIRASENGGQPFQIDVVSSNNKHWVLTNGSARSAGKTAAPPQEQRATNHAAETVANSGANAGQNSVKKSGAVDRQNIATAFQPLPMRQPRPAQPGRATSEMGLPSIGVDLPPRLASIDTGLAGPVRPPEVVAPAAPAAAAPSTAARATVAPGSRSSGFQGPVLIDHIEPTYPAQAKQEHVQGDVLVRVTIGKDGVPRLFELVRGDPRLVQSALTVIPHWRYKPATLNGQPVESQTVITVSFNLR
ncbi:MAG TPA: energy transducer TonB, partial [Candidatus Acidoferrales bacterium]